MPFLKLLRAYDFYTKISNECFKIQNEDEFEQYDEIMDQAKKYSKDCLFLIACGPAATVIAYDLCTMGYQAIDIGHLPNCYANEVSGAPMPEKLPISKKTV